MVFLLCPHSVHFHFDLSLARHLCVVSFALSQPVIYDVTQEVYGIPQYFASLSSVWLNEDTTLFRHKYYLNGAHSGFLLYMSNPNLTDAQKQDIKIKLNSAKGLGNFKNMFVNGKEKDKEKPELIPVGQLDAKDEFSKMKNVTTGDILSAHRIPWI